MISHGRPYVLETHGSSKHNSTVPVAASGNYTGDGSTNRAIPHGLGVAPKVVIIMTDVINNPHIFVLNPLSGDVYNTTETSTSPHVTVCDATNFYVGAASGGMDKSANYNTYPYIWAAIS